VLREVIMAERDVSLESRVAISDDVVSRDIEGEAVILNLESGTYFGLDQVGTRIWSLLQEDGSLRRTFHAIQQEYDVAPQTLESDILRLVGELRAKGLVSVSSSEEGQRSHV
jgi:Coenzyme PQQ synthesis protein D (PqqD)